MKTNLNEKQNIPEGWRSDKLGQYLCIEKGKLPKIISDTHKDGMLPYLSIKYFKGEEKRYADDDSGTLATKSDLLVIGDGSGSGRMYRGYAGLVSSTFLKISSNKQNLVSNDYLENLFTNFDFSKPQFRKGGAIPHFDFKQLKDVEVLIPPLKEQQKIAGILESIDANIEETKAVIKATEKLKKGLTQELFTRGIGNTKFKQTEIGEFPEFWDVLSLEESSEKLVVGFVGTCEPYYTDSSGIPMLRTGNLKKWGIDLFELKYVTREFHEKNTKSQLKPGDVLIARHGDNGLACIVPSNLPEANCLNIVIIRANQCLLKPEYLYYVINSPISKSQMATKTGGSTQKVVNTGDIKLVKIPVPDKSEQDKIVEILLGVDKKIQVNKKLLAKQTKLKKGLMQDLLSGNKRISI